MPNGKTNVQQTRDIDSALLEKSILHGKTALRRFILSYMQMDYIEQAHEIQQRMLHLYYISCDFLEGVFFYI